MATANFLARAAETADVWTFTVSGTPTVTAVYSIERNGKKVSFTAAAATAASVATGLLAALNAQTGAAGEAEFTEYEFATGGSGIIVGTATTAGIPATFTVSKSGEVGTGDIAAVHTTTATSPANWDDADNWDGGTIPDDGDTANVNLDLGSVLYFGDQSGVALAALNITSSDTTQNTFGLPKVNASGGYTEDRPLALEIGATLVKIDCNATMINLNIVGDTTLEARRTGTGSGRPALLVEGADTASVFEIDNGSMGLAYYDGETLAAATVRVGQQGSLITGAGATCATITSIGSADIRGAFTTLNHGGNGTAIVRGDPAATTITGTGGRVDVRFGGTLGALSLRNCNLDKSQDLTPLTITNTTLHQNGTITDPQKTITFTNQPARGDGVTTLSAA